MSSHQGWAVGIDLGGTKIEVAQVDAHGEVGMRMRLSTDVMAGPEAVIAGIAAAVRDLFEGAGIPPAGVGIGVAGQVEPKAGTVRFAPNLGWINVELGKELAERLETQVVVVNDVRAEALGEWVHGAGKGFDDLVCLFIGTGIGGGVVSSGRLLEGCSNTAGELGHITVDVGGRVCHCGNKGCLEALAGGWAIAARAQELVTAEKKRGRAILDEAGGITKAITAKHVAHAARGGDPLAREIVDEVSEALIAGCTSIVNAFNPCRLILGGGIIDGLPALVDTIGKGVQQRALAAATERLRVIPSALGDDAGVIGAATLALKRHGMM
jgi:glucokinase